MSLDDVIVMVVKLIKFVCNYMDDVEFFCEDVGCILYWDLCCIVESVIDVGVLIINLFDIVGYVMLDEYVVMIYYLMNNVLNIDKVCLSVYCYNDLGLVVVNLIVVV